MRYLVTCSSKSQANELFLQTVNRLFYFGYRIRFFERYGDTWIIDIIGTGNDIVFAGDPEAIERVSIGLHGKVVSHCKVEEWLEKKKEESKNDVHTSSDHSFEKL